MKMLKTMLPVVLIFTLTACGSSEKEQALTASGTISSHSVNISSEIGGRVESVLADESQSVKSGDLMVTLDTRLITAQLASAEAAVTLAQANLAAAESGLVTADLQYQQVSIAAHQADAANRTALWKAGQPDQVNQPGWYYNKAERIAAAQQALDAAEKALLESKTDLDAVIAGLGLPGLAELETRLANAEADFKVAKTVLDLANNAADQQELRQAAQDGYDAAKDKLNDIEQEYNDLLTDDQQDTLLNARALAALAQQSRDEALARYNSLLTGADSPQVKLAAAGLEQAKAAVEQAKAGLAQAEAARDVLAIQLEKTQVSAPMDGVILTRAIEPGEITSPGATLLVVADLDSVQLTIYVPEDRYGEVNLGQQVSVSVDSFPGETFSGTVTHIADKAEFTPRNVQTVEGRRTTVYAIDIELPNPGYRLKPGMPADVTFE